MARTALACIMMGLVASLFLGCEEVEEQAACEPLDSPSFQNVYSLVLEKSCAVGGSCHGGGATAGGLDLQDEAIAHASLLETESVVPGSASASTLMSRLDSSVNHPLHMPPGYLLTEAERCMIATWINEGAEP